MLQIPATISVRTNMTPAAGQYAPSHSRAWSRKIAGAGAIVFVTPR